MSSRYTPSDAEVAVRALEEICDREVAGDGSICGSCNRIRRNDRIEHRDDRPCGISARALATIRERAGTMKPEVPLCKVCGRRAMLLSSARGDGIREAPCFVCGKMTGCWFDEPGPPTERYPGQGVPWADFLHHRVRVLAEWRDEGKMAAECAHDMSMDPAQVRLLWMTFDEHPEVYRAASLPGEAPPPGSRADVEAHLGVKLVPPGSEGEAKVTGEEPGCCGKECVNGTCRTCRDVPSEEWLAWKRSSTHPGTEPVR